MPGSADAAAAAAALVRLDKVRFCKQHHTAYMAEESTGTQTHTAGAHRSSMAYGQQAIEHRQRSPAHTLPTDVLAGREIELATSKKGLSK